DNLALRREAYHAYVAYRCQKAAVFERKQPIIAMLLLGHRGPLLRRRTPTVQVLLRRQDQGALSIPHHLNRCFTREILRKPSLPLRFRYPLHQTLPERSDPKVAATVFQAGNRCKAFLTRAVMKIDRKIQPMDRLTQKPELTVPAHEQRTGPGSL